MCHFAAALYTSIKSGLVFGFCVKLVSNTVVVWRVFFHLFSYVVNLFNGLLSIDCNLFLTALIPFLGKEPFVSF